ncbi:MAG: TFIIB-type zinc ribbon-containing protein [Verrucomicrobia bacterium]|nr:TFIIB-type zinc ribbon-containing protein [Verrucomicrobiota bacterium]
MKISRSQIVAAGITHRCPNCGGRTLFRTGTLFQLNKNCTDCGLQFERDEGFFLGSMSLNYGVTIFVFLVPVLFLYLADVFSGMTASVLAGVGAIVFPMLFYRSSRSWWLMSYYFFLPQHLPANRIDLVIGEDDNI